MIAPLDGLFDRAFDAPSGVEMRLSPRIGRVLAPNPGPFTFRGTGVYLVGAGGRIAVIDPGPDIPAHLDALMRAIGSRQVSHILVTHAHRDHSPAARPLAQWSGAKVYAAAPGGAGGQGDAASGEEAVDGAFAPDVAVSDGDVIAGDGFTLRCVFTPGHTAGHMCFALPEEQALFSGDHVMGWSTSVIAPPDGNMGAYIASLEKLIGRGDRVLYPTHGAPIADPGPYLAALLAHRRDREAQVLAALPATIAELVARLYPDLDPRLRPAAAQTVAAHLIKLDHEGRAARYARGAWITG